MSNSKQSPPNTQSRANAATSRDLHHDIVCLGCGHSPSPMCLHGRPCIWLPFAAACCYTVFYLLMMPVARLVCQRPSSNFLYFRTPLANFLLSRPNSVKYGNSKTTTLLHSAKCTRPLQGRTGCEGRPSGWHDIVTCQRLVLLSCDRFFTIVYDHTTRGHSLKLFVPSSRVNCRQHFFAVRVIDVWNSPPEDVVAAQQLSSFVNRLKCVDLSKFLLGKR